MGLLSQFATLFLGQRAHGPHVLVFVVVLYVQDLTTKELSDYVKSRGDIAKSSRPRPHLRHSHHHLLPIKQHADGLLGRDTEGLTYRVPFEVSDHDGSEQNWHQSR